MRSIRSGRGLGDNIYLQSIVRHLINQGEALEVCTDWPDLFRPFGDGAQISPFRRTDIALVAHYTSRKEIAGTDQFRDCCLAVGIERDISLSLEWQPSRSELVPESELPVVLVQMYREPFDRNDGFGLDLLPRPDAIQQLIDALSGEALIVQVGRGKARHSFFGIDVDLVGKTSVPQLLDLACRAGGFLGYCSFFAPLAEALDAPALFAWSRRGLRSREPYIRSITPAKILGKSSSRAVMDDDNDMVMIEAAHAFLDAAASRRALRR